MIAVRPVVLTVRCPACGAVCDRVHSQYRRTLADLPAAGRRIVLVLRVRRFFCDDLTCRQRIFGERFDGAIQPRARRTARLDEMVYCLAIALGGRPAASLARRIGVAVSNDTLLRVVRRHGVANFPPPSVVGIDDWAWRRNHRYGSLICDLERRKTIALYRIGNLQPPKPGCVTNLRSSSSLATAEAAMLWRRSARFQRQSRSLTDGI